MRAGSSLEGPVELSPVSSTDAAETELNIKKPKVCSFEVY